MAEPLNITDEERYYYARNNDGLRAQKIMSLKSWTTWVRQNRELIDDTIRRLVGDGPIRHSLDAVDIGQDRDFDTGGTEQ